MSPNLKFDAFHPECLVLEVLLRLFGCSAEIVLEIATTVYKLWALTSTDWINTLITVI